ncbi:peptidoglycan-binding protein [Pseudoflavonifractor phocaeensis]|uniref:peptidoglycan-binding protein n=1 Tax=Pseudoflavonifractor phocaeensis TaxID=1870988 RepID=UPI001959E7F2|nr:peptidoglycan-binding protein [Pseudoflavonifractor phocaeensis]MBM6869747.1 peptidoglycan-binding protein [Pseudoflavonifractor phocaeensis]MBM6939198.1 peptidoglycan-binding protein [Pseudoflavonifractor phocaeensis]
MPGSDPQLIQVQRMFRRLAPLLSPLEDCPVSGRPCAATRRNLCRVQRALGLPQTGRLDDALAQRLARLEALCAVCAAPSLPPP